MAGLSLHMREGRQVRVSPPLRVNPSSQVKVQVPPTVCLSQSMVPFGEASSSGSQLRAEKGIMVSPFAYSNLAHHRIMSSKSSILYYINHVQ